VNDSDIPPDQSSSDQSAPNGTLPDLLRQLRNSITAASLSSEQLRRTHPGHEESSEELTRLRTALREAARLIGELLQSTPADDLQRRTIDLTEFLREREAPLRRRVGPRVVLAMNLEADHATVRASTPELDAILYILIDGAKQAMFGGGSLTISTSWIDQFSGAPLPHGAQAARYIRISVNDTGVGPAGDAYRRIADPAVAPNQPGLPGESVASRVRRLGGWVIVENFVQAGSRVHVCLPQSGEGDDT